MQHISLRSIVTVFVILFFGNLFGLKIFDPRLQLMLLFPFLVLQIFKESLYKKQLIMLAFGLILSLISSHIYRGQSYYNMLVVLVPYLNLYLYFIFKRIKISISELEKVLFCLIILFCLGYIYQYSVYPTQIFYGATALAEVDVDIRIRMIGQGVVTLGYFFFLNRLLIGEGNKIVNVSILLTCFGIVFLMGFRSVLFFTILFSAFLIIRILGFKLKLFLWLILAFCAIFTVSQLPFFESLLERMFERNETQNFANSDYIRLIQLKYFLSEHFKSPLEYVFGSGIPTWGKSQYATNMEMLAEYNGITFVDWGLIGLSWILGVPTVIAMVWYSIKAFLIDVDKRYYYAGTWMLFLVVISIVTMEFYRPGNFIFQAIVLYIVENVKNTEKI